MFGEKGRSIILALLLLVTCSVSALASEDSTGFTQRTPAITPRYSYLRDISVSLSFSGNTAYCKGSVTPSGSNSASVSVTLYKKNGSTWSYIASWFGSATNGNKATASGTAAVTSGTYKVTTRGIIGSGLEYPSTSVTKTK